MFREITFIARSLLLSGLICFVVNQAIKEKNVKQKLFTNLIITGSFFLLFLISFVVDFLTKAISLSGYVFFAIPFLGLWIVDLFIFWIIYYNKYKGLIKKRKEDLKERLYIVFKYNNFFYLDETKQGLKGITVNIPKRVMFHDEMLDKKIKSLALEVDKRNYLGSFTENKIRYQCYLVHVNNELKKHKKIEQLELINQEFLRYHKEIVLKIILNKKIADEY